MQKRWFLKDFANRCRAHRREAGMTQAQLGDVVNKTKQSIHRIEIGFGTTWTTADSIVSHFGGIDAFFGPTATEQREAWESAQAGA